MKYKLSALAFSMTFVLAWAGMASGGTESGGGGDPDVVEFLNYSNVIGSWLLKTKTSVSIQDSQKVHDLSRALAAMMNDQNLTPVQMTSEPLRDASGAEKIAVYQLEPMKIIIYRVAWKSL